MSAAITYPDTYNRFADSKKITLDKINQGINGSAGGTGGLARQVYMDRDPLPPDNVNIVAINSRSDGGSWTTWNPATGTWI
jgi:hypothetical protein